MTGSGLPVVYDDGSRVERRGGDVVLGGDRVTLGLLPSVVIAGMTPEAQLVERMRVLTAPPQERCRRGHPVPVVSGSVGPVVVMVLAVVVMAVVASAIVVLGV